MMRRSLRYYKQRFRRHMGLILLQICEHDNTVDLDSHTQVAQILGNKAKLVKHPIGHFDIYHGENFNKAVAAQVEFIKGIT